MIKSTYLAEMLGTFVFMSVFLKSDSYSNLQPFIIGLGLIAGLILASSTSGGHLNPAVSLVLHLRKNQSVADSSDLIGYVIAQLLGGIVALRLSDSL